MMNDSKLKTRCVVKIKRTSTGSGYVKAVPNGLCYDHESLSPIVYDHGLLNVAMLSKK